MTDYKIPATACIGHVHLKVTDLERSLAFYRDLLGYSVTQYYGDAAVFLSAGGYHHHIGLNTWHSRGAGPAPARAAGMYHMAILYPHRRDLAEIAQRLLHHRYPITGTADHGVSEAIYLNDPDGNGIELYWDKPQPQWPYNDSGELKMVSERLDLEELIREAGGS